MREVNGINYFTACEIARRYGTTVSAFNKMVVHDIESRQKGLTPLLPQFETLNEVKYWPEAEIDFILQRLAFRPMIQKKIFGEVEIEGPSKTNAYQRLKIERDYYMQKCEEHGLLREA